MLWRKLYVFFIFVLFQLTFSAFIHSYNSSSSFGSDTEQNFLQEKQSLFLQQTDKPLKYKPYNMVNKYFLIPPPPPPKKKEKKKKKVSSGHTRHLGGGPRAEDGGTRSDIVALGCLRGLGITAFTGMCFCSLPLYLLVPLSRWLLPQTDPPGKIID